MELTSEEILKQIDNEKFFEDQGLQIKKKRGKSWPCVCPFCGDAGHFSFSHSNGKWQCFKCKEKGNAISFYAKIHNCSNGEAVKAIKQYLGIAEDEPQFKGRGSKGKGKGSNDKSNEKSQKGATVHPFPAPGPDPAEPKKTPVYERLVQLTHLTEEHRDEFHKKRGFSDQTIDSLRFRSGGKYVADLVPQLEKEYTKDELVASGLLVEVNGTTVINDQLLDGRILIPYLDEQGICYHIRPHKLGFKEIPSQPYCRLLMKNRPEHIILTESEFKAAALMQWGIPAIGIPGISSFGNKNLPRLIDFLNEFGVRKITVLFDSEEKGNPAYPNFKEKLEDRYDTQYWSYMNAYLLNKKGNFQTRVGWLPEEWREEGKIDLDGALAQGRTREEIEKVISQAKMPNEFLDKLNDEAKKIVNRKKSRHFTKVNIERDFNKYKVHKYNNGKVVAEEYISNFVMNIKSSFYTPSGVIRNVELVNENGEVSDPFPIEPGSMTGVSEFKKFLFSKGNYSWRGSANDLTNMWEYEFARDTGDPIEMPEKIGRIKNKLWLFGNMAIKDGNVYRPDEDGVIWIDGRGYKPQTLKTEVSESSIPILQERVPDINEIAWKLKHCIGGYEAYIGMGWVVATIFCHDIFKAYNCVPILFPIGIKGSGKTTLMRWLMRFFGIDTNGITAGPTTTPNGIVRVLSYRSSLGVWVDEYRNEKGVIEKNGLFRSAYNRISSDKGTATAFQTKGFSVNAALAVSGEEATKDPGLFSRCIHIQISSYKRNRDHFDWLNQNSVQFSGFVYHLIKNYDDYKVKILKTIAELKSDLVEKKLGDDRTAENWAICAGAFISTVCEDIDFIKWVGKQCQEVKQTTELDSMLNQFWNEINVMLGTELSWEKYMRLDSEKLYIWYSGLYEAWAMQYKKKTGREPFDKLSILKYLQAEPYYLGMESQRIKNIPRKVYAIDIQVENETIREIISTIDSMRSFEVTR